MRYYLLIKLHARTCAVFANTSALALVRNPIMAEIFLDIRACIENTVCSRFACVAGARVIRLRYVVRADIEFGFR